MARVAVELNVFWTYVDGEHIPGQWWYNRQSQLLPEADQHEQSAPSSLNFKTTPQDSFHTYGDSISYREQ